MIFFAKILFKIGTFLRNPSLNKYFLLLKESENWSIEELKRYQFEKLKEFLIFVNKYSPYYKELFNKIGFNPESLRDIGDIKLIPVMDKNKLLNNISSIHSNFAFNKLIYSETSGTSGQPLKFYKNEEWDSHNRATMFRGYSWYGLKPWENNGYFWGYNFSKFESIKTNILDSLQNRTRLFSYEEKEIIRFIKKIENASYLNGYSSMIYEIAKKINKLKLKGDFNFKMIKGTSEKIYPSYQNVVREAFGAKMISEYGAAETGVIAYECKSGNMHINIENVIVEVEKGEIIVTNLLSKSFPIIRYKLGDSIKLADDNFRCDCGRKHPVILDVLGRVGKKIIGKNNVYPSLTFYYVFKKLADRDINLNYQAIQNEKGKVILKIEQNTSEHIKIIKDDLYTFFKDDVKFNIIFDSKIHDMNGKLKDFVTTIDD